MNAWGKVPIVIYSEVKFNTRNKSFFNIFSILQDYFEMSYLWSKNIDKAAKNIQTLEFSFIKIYIIRSLKYTTIPKDKSDRLIY